MNHSGSGGGSTLSTIADNTETQCSTPSNTRPTVTTTSSTILAANSNRKYAYIFNQSGTAIYIKLGATAVANEGFRIANNDFFEITSVKLWTGAVNAVRGTGSGDVDVFEGT